MARFRLIEEAQEAERQHCKNEGLNKAYEQLEQIEGRGNNAARQTIQNIAEVLGDDGDDAAHGHQQHFTGEHIAEQPEAVRQNLAQLRDNFQRVLKVGQVVTQTPPSEYPRRESPPC